MKSTLLSVIALISAPAVVSGYAFVSSVHQSTFSTKKKNLSTAASLNHVQRSITRTSSSSSTSLQMVDQQVLMGAGVAIAGLVAGIGMVAFTESQGERAKERGGGLSKDMSTKISGMLLEDVEVSSVSDIGSLTSKLESALKESGGINDDKMQELEMTEEEKKRIAEEADDGW